MSTSKLLQGKVALITGANRGIGRAIMEIFAEQGADIWACARKQTPEFEDYLSSLKGKYIVAISALYFDLTDESAIKEQLSLLVKRKEKIDILVNNAGMAYGGFFQMTSIQKLKEIFEVNFFSQILVTQYIIKIMMKQKTGSIINLTSITGIDANPGFTAYGSSKAAFNYATQTLSKEMASYNIRVNAIAPGLTETDMGALMEEKAKAKMIAASSMNRIGKPDEIADTALFLASDLSRFITGQIIRVDGGN